MKEFNLFEDYSITYQKFLRVFYGIDNSSIHFTKFTHTELSDMFPYLERASFEEILEEPKLVLTGRIAIVKDFRGKMIPYKVPIEDIEKNLECMDDYALIYDDNWIISAYKDIIHNPDTKYYELQRLAHELKKLQKYDERKNVCKVLKKRKDPRVRRYKEERVRLYIEAKENGYD